MANLGLDAVAGNVAVGGVIDVGALANDHGSGDAVASALADIQAGEDSISIGALFAKASADNAGGGVAKALTLAGLDPSSIHIHGNAEVTANARNLSGPGNGSVAASANAQLTFNNAATVIVDGNLAVLAHATNSGSNGVKAKGGVGFGPAGNIDLGGARIDVAVLNKGSNGGGSGAHATAEFVQNNGLVHLVIGSGGLNVQAHASSQGTVGAFANARAIIHQNAVSPSAAMWRSAPSPSAAPMPRAALMPLRCSICWPAPATLRSTAT